MLVQYTQNRLQNKLALLWFFFLLLGQLVFTLPEFLMLAMTAVGLYLLKKKSGRLGTDSSANRDFLLLSLCFSSIFFIKLISSAWASQPKSAIDNAFNHVHFLFWPFLVIYFKRIRVQFVDAIVPLTVCMLVASVWGAYRYWFHDDICFSAGVHNCGLLIQTLGTSILFFAWVLVSGLSGRQLKYWAVVGFAAALFTLWITQRRTEWIVLAVTLPMLLLTNLNWLRKNYKAVSVTVMLTLIGGILVMSIHPRFKEVSPELRAFFSGEQTTQDMVAGSSVGIRLEQYRIALAGISNKPLLGWGAGVKPRHLTAYGRDNTAVIPYSHFHNQFLQVLLETGLIGFFLASLCVAYIVRKLVWKPYFSSARPFAVLLGAIIVYHALRGMANHSFGYSPINTFFVVWTAALTSCILPSNPRGSANVR